MSPSPPLQEQCAQPSGPAVMREVGKVPRMVFLWPSLHEILCIAKGLQPLPFLIQ